MGLRSRTPAVQVLRELPFLETGGTFGLRHGQLTYPPVFSLRGSAFARVGWVTPLFSHLYAVHGPVGPIGLQVLQKVFGPS